MTGSARPQSGDLHTVHSPLAALGRLNVAFHDGGQGEFSFELTRATGPFPVEWLEVTMGRSYPGLDEAEKLVVDLANGRRRRGATDG
jgi:hypothetical protein